MTNMLENKTCTPCQGGIPPLTRTEAEALLKNTPKWTLNDGATAITRRFEFNNFKQAQEFVNKVGEIAEAENHHPDITFGWGYADVLIQTHAVNGLHENDFILAAKVDSL